MDDVVKGLVLECVEEGRPLAYLALMLDYFMDQNDPVMITKVDWIVSELKYRKPFSMDKGYWQGWHELVHASRTPPKGYPHELSRKLMGILITFRGDLAGKAMMGGIYYEARGSEEPYSIARSALLYALLIEAGLKNDLPYCKPRIRHGKKK